MSDVLVGGVRLIADEGAMLGYASDRCDAGQLFLGPDARVRSGSVIYVGSRIGANLETGHGVVIREECSLGDDVSVWSNSVIDYRCKIGSRVKIHSNCYVAQYTEINDDAFLAPGVTIANDLYPRHPGSRQVMSGPCIGAGARIGVNVTILPFVRIGQDALIGAGSVVTRDIPDHVVAFGNPATVRHHVDELIPIARRIVAVPASASRYRFSPASEV
jgi:acetyltransferase-like isoleucine patch superfamily enzyme